LEGRAHPGREGSKEGSGGKLSSPLKRRGNKKDNLRGGKGKKEK